LETRFQGVDYYDLDDLLSEEEKLVRSTVRQFVDDRVLPVIARAFGDGRFPEELIAPIAELGLLGASIRGYGCAGVGPVAYGLILQELERGDSGIRSFVSVQGSLAMYAIYAFGSEAQKEQWLPRMARGEAIGCFGLTEPDFGSNPAGMLARAERRGDEYVLNGTKMWITNGSIADVAVVWAKVDGKMRGFLVEKGDPGFRTSLLKNKWSLRASVTSELVLEDVRLPADAILPKTGGLKSALMCLTQARYGIAWGALGAALACFDEALQYSKERVVFDKPLAAFQIPQQKLANMATQITLGQLIALRIGRLKDEGRVSHAHVSMAKRNNVQIALDTARICRDMLGANGVSLEYQVGRHLCNLESVYTYEGTHDIHTLSIGNELTGMQAFR
jgi:glutaryl-CoA dehydrogenase